MKKIVIRLLCFLCALILPLPVLGEGMDTTLASDNGAYGIIHSACEMKGRLYFLSSTGLYSWDVGMGEPVKLIDLSLSQRNVLMIEPPDSTAEKALWEKGMSALFTDGMTLYGLHPYTGQVFKWEDEGFSSIIRIPEDQFYYTDQGKSNPKEIKSVFFAEGKLYLVLSSFTAESGDIRELFAWDLYAPAMDLLNAPGIEAAFPGPERELLVQVVEKKTLNNGDTPMLTLWRYDLASQTFIQKMWDEVEEDAAGIVWRKEDQALYFTSNGGKVKKVLLCGKTQVKAYLPLAFAGSDDQAFITDDGAYVYIGMGSLFIRNISFEGEKQQRSITVMGLMDSSSAIAFSAKHPDITLVIESTGADFLTIQQSMVSGDANIDLYIVNSARSYKDVRDKGYAAPMNSNAFLLSQAKQFYPAVQGALFEGDNLLAFPLNLMPDTWTLNRTVWDRLGLGEYPATFEALFKVLEIWDKTYAKDQPDYTFLETYEGFFGYVALIVKQYLLHHEAYDSPVSFDDPAFREAVQAAFNYRATLENQNEGWNSIIMTYPQYLGVGYNDSNEVVTIPPPALTADSPRMVKASMDLFILNPLSTRPQDALEFVAFYAQEMNATTKYALNASLNMPLRPENFEKEQQELKERIAMLELMLKDAAPEDKNDVQALIDQEKNRYEMREKDNWLVSKESIDIYRELANNLVVPLCSIFANDRGSLGDEVIEQVIRRFADGQLTVDQFIRELDKKAQMVFREGK